jgi:hypothetical protein
MTSFPPVIAAGVSYVGTILGKTVASLALLLSAGHTAVWLGASTPNAQRWIQAGLEGSRPYAYVERGVNGQQVSLREWPVPPGHVAHVRLVHRGNYYRVIIDGYKSRRMFIPHARKITTLETNGPAKAIINDHLVVAS